MLSKCRVKGNTCYFSDNADFLGITHTDMNINELIERIG